MAYTGNTPSYIEFPLQQLSGDGVKTGFSLNYPVSSDAAILVFIGGRHISTAEYNAGATTIQFLTAPPLGTNNIEILWLGVPSQTQTVPSFNALTLTATGTGLTVSGSPAVPPSALLNIGGTLNVSTGGTGRATLPNNLLLLGQGTNAISSVPAGAAEQALVLDASAIPSWQNIVNRFAVPSDFGLAVTPASGTGAVTLSLGGTVAAPTPLTVKYGGTGNTAGFAQGRLILGSDLAPLRAIAGSGTAGQVLMSNGGTNDPSFSNLILASATLATIPIGGLVFGPVGGTSAPAFPIAYGATITVDGATITLSASNVLVPNGTYRSIGTANSSTSFSPWIRIS